VALPSAAQPLPGIAPGSSPNFAQHLVAAKLLREAQARTLSTDPGSAPQRFAGAPRHGRAASAAGAGPKRKAPRVRYGGFPERPGALRVLLQSTSPSALPKLPARVHPKWFMKWPQYFGCSISPEYQSSTSGTSPSAPRRVSASLASAKQVRGNAPGDSKYPGNSPVIAPGDGNAPAQVLATFELFVATLNGAKRTRLVLYQILTLSAKPECWLSISLARLLLPVQALLRPEWSVAW
jgi:hypothetical protein